MRRIPYRYRILFLRKESKLKWSKVASLDYNSTCQQIQPPLEFWRVLCILLSTVEEIPLYSLRASLVISIVMFHHKSCEFLGDQRSSYFSVSWEPVAHSVEWRTTKTLKQIEITFIVTRNLNVSHANEQNTNDDITRSNIYKFHNLKKLMKL